jgi:hypothetical protein
MAAGKKFATERIRMLCLIEYSFAGDVPAWSLTSCYAWRKTGGFMTRFVKFSEVLRSLEGPIYRDVFINPRHVRVVIAGDGGALIQLEGQEILVREDVDTVIKALS